MTNDDSARLERRLELAAAAVFFLGDYCPLCEALEALLAAKVKPEGRGSRLVRESFRVSRAAMLGGCWDGEG